MLKILIKIFIAILAFSLIFYFADLKEVFAVISNISLNIFIWLMLISVALVLTSTLKWKLFLSSAGHKISTLKLFLYYLVGYFVNLAFPSYVGGDLVRSLYVAKKTGEYSDVIAATVLERYTGFVALTFLAFIAMFFSSIVTIDIKLSILALAISMIIITYIACSKNSEKLINIFPLPLKIKHKLQKLRSSLLLGISNPSLMSKALILSLVFHNLTMINTLACGIAVFWLNIPIVELFVVLPLILLIGALPISPNGLGIQEGAFVFFLTRLGASPEQAFALALVLRAKTYCLALIGGLVWLCLGQKKILEKNG